jgi:integrase
MDTIDRSPGDMNLTTLMGRCSLEMSKYRRRASSDDCYCLEIFRRALVQRRADAWDALYAQFYESVCHWFRRHPYREAALRYDTEKSYVDDTFKRFWQWANKQPNLEFTSLAGALKSLHLCLNCAIMDTLRTYARPKEETFPDYGTLDDCTLLVEDSYHQDEWWSVVESILINPREQRVIYLLYHCGLKPREIIQHCPGEFADEQEIYRLTRNSLDRLRRNADKLRWKLSVDC